jgi:hypothetical protein
MALLAILLFVSLPAQLSANPKRAECFFADQTPVERFILAFSWCSSELKRSDGVFADGFWHGYYDWNDGLVHSSFEPRPDLFQSGIGQFGFRIAYVRSNHRGWGTRYDMEFCLGLVNRHFEQALSENTSYACKLFLGPQYGPPDGRVSGYVLFGLNYLKVGGQDPSVYTSSGPNIIYYGSGGTSDLWADILNEWEDGGPVRMPGYPPFSRLAVGMCIGISYDVIRPPRDIDGVSLYVDYLPVFYDGLRNDFRFGLALAWED